VCAFAVMCTASVRSSSRASSSSCTSSIPEEDSEISEVGGDEFVPPRPVPAQKTAQQQRQLGETPRRKPVLKPHTAQYLSKSPKTVAREPALSSGWQSRPQRDARADAGVTLESGPLSPVSRVPRFQPMAPSSTGVFKVPRTPPVSSTRPKDAGSRIQRVVPAGEVQTVVDGAAASRPATASGAESTVTRAATPPPGRLQSSSSDMALSAAGSGSSTRTQSRIPTRAGARPTQRGTAASSRGSSPGSTK